MNDVNMEGALKAAQKVSETVAILRQQRQQMLDQAKDLEARNAELQSRPLAREDAKQFIFDVIDREGLQFIELANWGKVMQGFAYPDPQPLYYGTKEIAPLCLTIVDRALGVDGVGGIERAIGRIADGFVMGAAGDIPPYLPGRFYFLFGEEIKRKLDQHFDALFPAYNNKEPAPTDSLAERREEIARNSERITALRADAGVIRRQLDELGAR